ncbi:hypothetical protein [Niallia circulans]|uniref:Uncharacterized protein n=1 Tax=Niallia circulans TaxID=1397 RepID=A0A941GJ50_NIACI|nr:hypothetical protein [Niallia circulans]MCB5238915.1 hypothetical protein [Niallia circulans]
MEQLKDLVFDLDCEISNMENTLIDLNDAKVFLGDVEARLDAAAYNGKETFDFYRHHREVRILSQLLRQALSDLNTSQKKADLLRKSLFNEVVQEKQSSVAVHTLDEIERTKQHNRKAFVEAFNREPENDDEVFNWVTSILEECKKRAV